MLKIEQLKTTKSQKKTGPN